MQPVKDLLRAALITYPPAHVWYTADPRLALDAEGPFHPTWCEVPSNATYCVDIQFRLVNFLLQACIERQPWIDARPPDDWRDDAAHLRGLYINIELFVNFLKKDRFTDVILGLGDVQDPLERALLVRQFELERPQKDDEEGWQRRHAGLVMLALQERGRAFYEAWKPVIAVEEATAATVTSDSPLNGAGSYTSAINDSRSLNAKPRHRRSSPSSA